MMDSKIKRAVNEYIDTMLKPDVFSQLRATIHEFEPSIIIDENSMFTFLYGYIFGRLSESMTVGSKELREIIAIMKDRSPDILSKIQDNFRKYKPRLTRKNHG